MLVMSAAVRVARLILALLLLAFLTGVIAFASGMAAWLWLLYGPGAG
jgi:hypothetical protein